MTPTQKAVEAALSAYVQHPAKGDAMDAMKAALTAALVVDGLCLVDAMDVLPSFKVGDRVTHTDRQEDGTVTAIAEGCVFVEFDLPTPRGNISVGKYDAAWFRMHPKGLVAAANDGEERR